VDIHDVAFGDGILTDDYLARPSPTAWDAVPVAARERLYGQDSLPTLEQDVAAWARLDGCGKANIKDTPWGQQTDWSGCERNVRVRGLSVDHLGHEWPGSKPSEWNRAHPEQASFSFTDLIWGFLHSVD
jgi:poly(3-hydroxybutyrate) depolymerase